MGRRGGSGAGPAGGRRLTVPPATIAVLSILAMDRSWAQDGVPWYLEQDLWPPSKSCGSTGRAPYIRRVLPIWPGARPFRADVQWLLTLPVRCRRGTTRSVRFSHAVPRRCAGSRRRSWTPNTRAVTPTGSSAAACWCRRRRRGSRSWLSCFCCSALLLRGPRARVRRLAGGWR